MVSVRLNAVRTCRAIGLAAALTACPDGHADKPRVVVQFEVAVPAFTANLPERALAEQHVREALSTEFARRYVFADWATKSGADGAPQLGRVVLRLEQDPNTLPNPRVYATWLGSAGITDDGGLTDLGMERIEIYSPGNPNWDTNDRRDFETHLLDKAMEKVGTDAFYQVFFQKFLARLPIASTVEPLPNDRVIEVPLPWSDVVLSSDSKLVVRFAKSIANVTQRGSLTLTHIATRTAQGAAGAAGSRLRGSIAEADYDGQPLTLEHSWNDRVPEILNSATARCYIADYKPPDALVGDADLLGL